jgi:hypothetical protein
MRVLGRPKFGMKEQALMNETGDVSAEGEAGDLLVTYRRTQSMKRGPKSRVFDAAIIYLILLTALAFGFIF